MKKIASNLFLLSGILFLFSAIKSEDMSTWLALGSANIALGIVFRKKSSEENSEEDTTDNESESN